MQPMDTTTDQAAPDVFQALANLEAGAWKIKADWKSLGLSPDLAKRNGWVHVSKSTVNGKTETDLMWTTSRETHDPLAGPAHSLSIDGQGLVMHAKSALSMHMGWSRATGRVGDERYTQALDVAKSLHQAMVIDKRAKLMPASNPDGDQSVRKPRGP